MIDIVEYNKQTSQIESKITDLRSERRKKLNESESDVQLDELKCLNGVLEDYSPSGEFDESLFQDIVEKIVLDDNSKLTFHLIGGLTLTEEIKERGRCRAV